jgi:hypothetical protein
MAYFQYAVSASILHDEQQKRTLLGVFERALKKVGGELESPWSGACIIYETTCCRFLSSCSQRHRGRGPTAHSG